MKHVVVAAGWPFKHTRFAGEVRTSPASSLKAPDADGMRRQDEFAGTIVHSKDFHSAAPYVGKRVLVVGAASSGLSLYIFRAAAR